MRTKELIEYLESFHNPEAEVGFLIAWPEKRKFYRADTGVFADSDHPVFCIEIAGEEDFDAVRIAIAEKDEQEDEARNQ